MSIFTDTTTYRVVCCYKCSVTFGMPMGLYLARKNDHEMFWCPNGHEQGFVAESEADQLRRELKAEQDRVAAWKQLEESASRRAVAAEHSRRVVKGHLTRIKRRVAAGVCPCCQRTFKNLADHMKGQHPEFAEATP